MTSRYRVEYALKSHRRDQLIEWIKGLLAVPFVLHSQPAAVYDDRRDLVPRMAPETRRRYAEIMRDVESLIDDHIANQRKQSAQKSKLKHLVPSVGVFFTRLPLEDAFLYQDDKRRISSRRFVAPSFNDIRLTLNTAQILSLVRDSPLQLVSFDGDLTLYADGASLEESNPVIPRIIGLLSAGLHVGIVTAAGYTAPKFYHHRLHGLLDAIHSSKSAPLPGKFVIIGGECQYLLEYDAKEEFLLRMVPREIWMLEAMRKWPEEEIKKTLDVAEDALRECVDTMCLDARMLRKERAVGIIRTDDGGRFPREALEETVLVTQQKVEVAGGKVPFCAFNGGNDVFVDIGDKSWGVMACQNYLGGIEGARTLHVGDQFLSAGANDFKARQACTTAWVANPAETVQLLDELSYHTQTWKMGNGA